MDDALYVIRFALGISFVHYFSILAIYFVLFLQ